MVVCCILTEPIKNCESWSAGTGSLRLQIGRQDFAADLNKAMGSSPVQLSERWVAAKTRFVKQRSQEGTGPTGSTPSANPPRETSKIGLLASDNPYDCMFR